MRGIDAVLEQLSSGLFDVRFGFDGDLETADSFDTAIVVSLFTHARADPSEVALPERRRGWAGNEYTPGFEIGSTLWVPLEQGRLRRTELNAIEDGAREGLAWFVEQGLAVRISGVRATITAAGAVLELTIERSPAETVRRFFTVWSNTGLANAS